MPDKSLSVAEIEQNKLMLRHLKGWLNHRQITQRHLAILLGVSEPLVSKWIRGLLPMTLAQFDSIATILGVTPVDLMSSPQTHTEVSSRDEIGAILKGLDLDSASLWLAVGRAMKNR